MTEEKEKSRLETAIHPRAGRVALCVMSVFTLSLILRNSEIAIAHMSEGLRLCVTTVIPSLFPFMVVSELIVSGGAVRAVGRLLARPFRRLFGISGDGGCAVILGMLCGFPIGTKSAVSLYRQKKIGRDECARLLTFSNNPSSAFLISAVGTSLFGSRFFGVLLYVLTLLSALLVGLFGNLLRKKSEREAPCAPSERSAAPTVGGITAFTGAVTSSALSMLSVCAFVVFFCALTGTLEHLLSAYSIPEEIAALCFGFFELTGGVARAASCSPAVAGYLCALIVGWSGLSVHFQIMSLCAELPISFRPYFIAKLAQGILNALLLFGYQALFGSPLG